MSWLLVIAGASVGAPLRYLVDRAISSRHSSAFPWGTLVVNVAGCLTLGFLAGAATSSEVPAEVQSLVGTGFCGALTTYSTLSYETLRLAETGSRPQATMNVVANVVTGLAAATAGFALAALSCS